jgi:arginine/lysine/ornithine decarboxylase
MRRTLLAVLCAGALLGAAACGGDEKAAPGNQVDSILASTADIVFQCRAVESGLLSSPNTEVLQQDVDALLAAAAEFDLDAPFQRPQPALESETTLREQIELAVARLEGMCSPEHADELRAAID